MRKVNKRILIGVSICIVWLLVIFIFSAMNATSSSSLTDSVLEVVEYIRNRSSIIDNLFTTLTQNHSLFFIIRKMAHMFVFCVLQIISFSVFRTLNMSYLKSAIFSMLAVFGYACLDEFHQLFVPGRSGQFTDVMIDTLGGIIGLSISTIFTLLLCLIKKVKEKYLNADCCKNK